MMPRRGATRTGGCPALVGVRRLETERAFSMGLRFTEAHLYERVVDTLLGKVLVCRSSILDETFK
jgi:hypothetical protein